MQLFVRIAVCWAISFATLTSSAHADSPSRCWPEEFYKTLTKEEAPLLGHAPPESSAITRRQVAVKGTYEPQIISSEIGADETAEFIILGPKPGKTVKLSGIDYQEFPNSTAFRVLDQTSGNEREYLLTRGVRSYENKILPTGVQAPQGYVSDVLLFERNPRGKFEYVETVLKSAPENKFFFEDPRISVIYGEKGKPHFFLSGTDYSSHVPGSENLDVMNRWVKLDITKNGAVTPVKVDASGRPTFSDMSPAPQLRPDGGYSFVDAKNGTMTRNEKGEIVVRMRLRPDFGDEQIKKIAHGNSWHYGEQVFVFKDWNEYRHYEWKHALEDLFQPANTAGAAKRVHPTTAKEIIRDTDLVEMFKDERVYAPKGKGLGPGSIPVRVRREGDKLFISDGVGAKEQYAGVIPKDSRKSFILKEGEVKFLAPDHEIRYFKEKGFLKRHYTASFKLFDDTLTKIDAYFADAIQPITLRERGVTTGIADLQHTYPMGRTIVPGKAGSKAKVRIYSGTSDANTSQYDLDPLKMLIEMSEGSERRASGQVYSIKR
jgi:hypothetical protein